MAPKKLLGFSSPYSLIFLKPFYFFFKNNPVCFSLKFLLHSRHLKLRLRDKLNFAMQFAHEMLHATVPSKTIVNETGGIMYKLTGETLTKTPGGWTQLGAVDFENIIAYQLHQALRTGYTISAKYIDIYKKELFKINSNAPTRETLTTFVNLEDYFQEASRSDSFIINKLTSGQITSERVKEIFQDYEKIIQIYQGGETFREMTQQYIDWDKYTR